MPRTFVVRSTSTARGMLQHGCPLKKASLAETVQVSTQNREIGCCCSKTLSPCRCEDAAFHKWRLDARSMSVTMGTKSKVCIRPKVHVSSKSLIHCVAKSGFHPSTSKIAVTFERNPVTWNHRRFTGAFARRRSNSCQDRSILFTSGGWSRKKTRYSVMTSTCRREAG